MGLDQHLISIREQIQEDIISFASIIDDDKVFLNDDVLNALCDIVVTNFTKLTNVKMIGEN